VSEKTEFTNGQLRVLKSLLDDARKSITKISQDTKMSSKRVKALLEEIQKINAIHFTIHFNFSALGNTNFVLKLAFNEKRAEPNDIVDWIQTHHSHEYWNSFLYVHHPIMMNFFSCSHLRDVRRITQNIKEAPFANTAEPLVIYPSKMGKGLGGIRLEELLLKLKI
jgi:DNA-binding Lrp family transcriptional regulator